MYIAYNVNLLTQWSSHKRNSDFLLDLSVMIKLMEVTMMEVTMMELEVWQSTATSDEEDKTC